MTYALYANGMIGGNDLTKEINAINRYAEEARAKLLGIEEVLEFSDEAPMPKASEEDGA